jgi:nucleoside-diphosphate-sugar epimerase
MRISIIGLGWLGKPLAQYLLQKDWDVKGSTTQREKLLSLEQEGIHPFLFNLMPHPQGQAFQGLFDTDILFINIPPGLRHQPDTFHPEQVKYLKALAEQHRVKKVIYISSTSVYPSEDKTYTEEEPLTKETTGNKSILEAERILWADHTYDLTVIRFGGLMGGQRIPGRYFSGKSNVEGDVPVNYIHQEDAIRLAVWVVENRHWNETINGVCPLHPSRKEIYQSTAARLGFPPPISYSEDSSSRTISSDKIARKGFVFQHPDPLQFPYSSDV